MNTTFPISGQFIATREEQGYQAVIDTFSSTKWIDIVTYSISYKNSVLNTLKSSPLDCQTRIVSNIPGNNKEQYLKALKPDSFNNHTKVYLDLTNHGKIIMTDSIAYIGSANFSGSGFTDFGILTDDNETIRKLKAIVDDSCRRSAFYYSPAYAGNLDAFHLADHLEMLRNVWHLAKKYKDAMAKDSKSFIIDVGEIEPKKYPEEDKLAEYLYSLDMNQIMMLQYVMYIGRDYNPSDYTDYDFSGTKYADISEITGDEIIKFFFDDYNGISNWEDNVAEANHIMCKSMALPSYLERGVKKLIKKKEAQP